MRRLVSSGSSFEAEAAYSRALVDGDWVFVSGTTGFDYATGEIPDGMAEQADRTFANIADALAKADSSMRDVVRVTYYLTDAADWPSCKPVMRRWLDDVRPAATAIVVAGLVDPRMKVEIEVTARRSAR